MKKILLLFLIIVLYSCNNQNKIQVASDDLISGEWVYRSMHNIPDENIPFCEKDSIDCKNNLEFATAIMRLNSKNGVISGELDMGQWGKLKMSGKFLTSEKFEITGTGLPNSSTNGWIYDYYGYTIPNWKFGINQEKTLVGSVIRSADHGNSRKGKVASFYMVKKSK